MSLSALLDLDDPSPLAARATDYLRADILACRLPPGATLSEATLATRIGLGRAPIRAALARLADEGLVQAIPRRGWIVTQVTIRDIHEVFDLRLILEPEAARRTAEAIRSGRADPARLHALNAICAERHDPADPDSALAFLTANARFHTELAELAGNQRLARQLARLLDEATRMLVMGLSCRDRSQEMAHEHNALLDALGQGDAPEAAAIMAEQVAASRAMVLAALTGPTSTLVVSEPA
jgi:DNA-binding GntR family transcriptional regulator